MRIALVHSADFGGGAERSVLTLHQSLLRMGHESRLYVGTRLTDAKGVIEIPTVRSMPGLMRGVYWLERNLGWQHFYAPRLRHWCRTVTPVPDVVHIHTLWGGRYGYADVSALPAISRRFPTVLTLREAWMTTGHCACPMQCERWKQGCGQCPDLKRAPGISRDATRFNFGRKQRAVQRSRLHVTTVSDWLADEVRQSPIFAGKPISTVYNSVDETVFTPGSQAEARAAMGIPGDGFFVLMAGQTVEGINEGIAQEGVQALNRCAETGLQALVVGRSADRVAASLQVSTVTLPFQTEPQRMALCYRAADLTLVTSAYESFGRIAVESQMCGTPVLAFATGGLREVVGSGTGGMTVPAGDIGALERSLRELSSNADLRERMTSDGPPWAKRRFSTEVITAEYLDVYREAQTGENSDLPLASRTN